MSNYRVAVRYARSLLELAIENNKLDSVKEDMGMFHQLCRQSREFLVFLKNPIIHSYKKHSILKIIFEKKIEKLTFRFIEIVTRKAREEILPEIAEQFLIQYRLEKKIELVDVITPIKLDSSLKEEFKRIAQQYVGKGWTIKIKEKVSKELIGGFILKVGDRQVDDSVSTKLRELRRKLVVS